VLADHEFRRGAVGTDFLKRRTDLLFGEPPAAGPDIALGAGVVRGEEHRKQRAVGR